MGYVLLHFAPFIPLLTRTGLLLWHRSPAQEPLPEEAAERDLGRALGLALAGFSLTALLALLLVAAQGQPGAVLAVPVYFLFLSFLFFLGAVAAEGHKQTRWVDFLTAGLREAGTLALLLGLIVLFLAARFPAFYSYLLPIVGLSVWVTDHLRALYRIRRFLHLKEERWKTTNVSPEETATQRQET